jgi:hypothetical protein
MYREDALAPNKTSKDELKSYQIWQFLDLLSPETGLQIPLTAWKGLHPETIFDYSIPRGGKDNYLKEIYAVRLARGNSGICLNI